MFSRNSVQHITPEALRSLMFDLADASFVLVDVRQEKEYRQEHLPGAVLMPVADLEHRLTELKPDQDVVFYCSSGARSAAAALLAEDSGHFTGTLYSLRGGITAWNSGSVADLPRVDVFAGVHTERELLFRALDMEKAAHMLYTSVREATLRDALCDLMDTLIGIEVAHARVVYKYLTRYWADAAAPLPAFERMFAELTGRVLEGGLSADDLKPWIRGALTGDCLELADLALEMELNAYDLYRTLARQSVLASTQEGSGMGSEAELIFLDLAAQEKHHARLIMTRISAFEAEQAAAF